MKLWLRQNQNVLHAVSVDVIQMIIQLSGSGCFGETYGKILVRHGRNEHCLSRDQLSAAIFVANIF